jgi:hypothetical protein
MHVLSPALARGVVDEIRADVLPDEEGVVMNPLFLIGPAMWMILGRKDT